MNAKSKKKLRLSQETVRRLTETQVLAAVGGATLRCTGTDACTETCPAVCTGTSCFC